MSGIESLFGLRGKVAVVTGSSSGLGTSMARALARAGADVALLARRREQLEAVARELTPLSVRALAVPVDVTDRAAIDAAVEQIERELGPIDILVNAAGVAPAQRAENYTRERWQSAMNVNVTALFEMSQAVGKRMIQRGLGGRIIQISSVLGERGSPVHPVVGYAASKGAVNNLTRQLAVEWAKHRITVNAIAPGYFPTEMTTLPETGEVPEAARREIEHRTPMARMGEVSEIETAVLFLAAPASSYVTGVILPVDGGWSAW